MWVCVIIMSAARSRSYCKRWNGAAIETSNTLDVVLSKDWLREIGDTVTTDHLNEDILHLILFDCIDYK